MEHPSAATTGLHDDYLHPDLHITSEYSSSSSSSMNPHSHPTDMDQDQDDFLQSAHVDQIGALAPLHTPTNAGFYSDLTASKGFSDPALDGTQLQLMWDFEANTQAQAQDGLHAYSKPQEAVYPAADAQYNTQKQYNVPYSNYSLANDANKVSAPGQSYHDVAKNEAHSSYDMSEAASSTETATQSSSQSVATTTVHPYSGDVIVFVSIHCGNRKVWPSRHVQVNIRATLQEILYQATNIDEMMSVQVDGEACNPRMLLCNVARVVSRPSVSAFLHSTVAGAQQQHVVPQRQSFEAEKEIEITYEVSKNVKSCSRFGCLNLLLKSSFRRACQLCASKGYTVPNHCLRRIEVQPSDEEDDMVQQLETALTSIQHWRFDAREEERCFYLVFLSSTDAEQAQTTYNQTWADAQTAMQTVTEHVTYTIKMKSHFWMLECKSDIQGTVQVKLYKKIGKANQQRPSRVVACNTGSSNSSNAVKQEGSVKQYSQDRNSVGSNHLQRPQMSADMNGNESPYSIDARASTTVSPSSDRTTPSQSTGSYVVPPTLTGQHVQHHNHTSVSQHTSPHLQQRTAPDLLSRTPRQQDEELSMLIRKIEAAINQLPPGTEQQNALISKLQQLQQLQMTVRNSMSAPPMHPAPSGALPLPSQSTKYYPVSAPAPVADTIQSAGPVTTPTTVYETTSSSSGSSPYQVSTPPSSTASCVLPLPATNAVYMNESSYSTMKSQPVPAKLQVYGSGDNNHAYRNSNTAPHNTSDAQYTTAPITQVTQEQPVFLVYRDLQQYYQDVAQGYFNHNSKGGGGSGRGSGGSGPNGYGGSNGPSGSWQPPPGPNGPGSGPADFGGKRRRTDGQQDSDAPHTSSLQPYHTASTGSLPRQSTGSAAGSQSMGSVYAAVTDSPRTESAAATEHEAFAEHAITTTNADATPGITVAAAAAATGVEPSVEKLPANRSVFQMPSVDKHQRMFEEMFGAQAGLGDVRNFEAAPIEVRHMQLRQDSTNPLLASQQAGRQFDEATLKKMKELGIYEPSSPPAGAGPRPPGAPGGHWWDDWQSEWNHASAGQMKWWPASFWLMPFSKVFWLIQVAFVIAAMFVLSWNSPPVNQQTGWNMIIVNPAALPNTTIPDNLPDDYGLPTQPPAPPGPSGSTSVGGNAHVGNVHLMASNQQHVIGQGSEGLDLLVDRVNRTSQLFNTWASHLSLLPEFHNIQTDYALLHSGCTQAVTVEDAIGNLLASYINNNGAVDTSLSADTCHALNNDVGRVNLKSLACSSEQTSFTLADPSDCNLDEVAFRQRDCTSIVNQMQAMQPTDLAALLSTTATPSSNLELLALQYFSRSHRLPLQCNQLLQNRLELIQGPTQQQRNQYDRWNANNIDAVAHLQYRIHPVLFLIVMGASSGITVIVAVALYWLGEGALFTGRTTKKAFKKLV